MTEVLRCLVPPADTAAIGCISRDDKRSLRFFVRCYPGR
jgi:hypothetical protein